MGGFLNLPKDILISLPEYMEVIEDLINLSATCRAMRELYYDPPPRVVLRLCSESNVSLFRPLRYFLVAAVSEQLANWASKSQTNVFALQDCCKEGVDGLLDLCMEHCGLSIAHLRELHVLRSSTFDVVIEFIDKCYGSQCYGEDDFWDTVEDVYTIASDAQDHFYQLAIYGGLFGPTRRAYLEKGTMVTGSNGVVVGGVETRMEFIKYCIPDLAAVYNNESSGVPVHPLRHIDYIGPYKKTSDGRFAPIKDNQDALMTCLKRKKFSKYWDSVRLLAGPDFPDDSGDVWDPAGWKQRIWQTVILCHGLDGFQMMDGGKGALRWQPQLIKWRHRIENMTEAEKRVQVEYRWTYEFPWLRGDLNILLGWGH
ncbi:hypothetical protein P154DRAFT_525608 [Amniculicola lignicola CBS 123094]|uniref:F-box domain-containing protein n=1 Tax=Amniculicola lignicola CBS 123094 TaxID=1392246 RepID=A0A6A5W5G5_9PLEO|nr:hypothetical protein P154DRAFT_525608 [Amniculicola lignicola CBS 123094]